MFRNKLIFLSFITYIALLASCQNTPEYESVMDAKAGTYGAIDAGRAAKYNLQLGMGYLDQGDVERAKSKFLKAYKLAPNMPEVQYNIAHFYYLINENKLANKHFRQAINLAESNNDKTGTIGVAHNNYGVFLCQTGKGSAAESSFKLAIADPFYANTASAYENAGLCFLNQKNSKKAKYYFEKAIKQNPLSAKALIEVAELYVLDKNYSKAKIYLERLSQLNMQSKRTMLLSLKLARLTGDKGAVEELTRKINEFYPETKSLLKNKQAINSKKQRQMLVGYTEIGELKKVV